MFSDDQSYATQSYATVAEEVWREVAFHDVDEASILRTLPRLAERQATEPLMAPAALTAERFGAISKTYTRTALDRIVTLALQDRVIQNWKVDRVATVQAGHFPAQSVAEELANELLLEVAERAA